MFLRCSFALLTAVFFFTTACGSKSDHCPGLCPPDSTFPTMAIEVTGGAATIASAEIMSGACARLMVRSEGEAGAPKGYAAAQVTYNGTIDVPAPCLIKLTSLFGDTAVVTASLTASGYQQACCPVGSCCPQASAIMLHARVVFDQPVQTISFPIPPGPSLDGGELDAALDAESNSVDAGLDASALD